MMDHKHLNSLTILVYYLLSSAVVRQHIFVDSTYLPFPLVVLPVTTNQIHVIDNCNMI